MKSTSLEYEEKIIKYLLSDRIYLSIALSRLKKEYFNYMRPIYEILEWYFKEYNSKITGAVFSEQIKNKITNSDDKVNLRIYFDEAVTKEVNNEGEFHYLCDRLIDEYKRKKTIKLATTIVDANPEICNNEDLEKLHQTMQKTLTDIQSTDFDISREGDIANEADDRLKEYEHIKEHPEDLKLIKTGFQHIDNAIVGWNYGSSNFVAGRKGDGKSVFLLNIAYYLWKQKINVLLFSLEIDKQQYARRWDSRCAGVDSRGLKSGTLDEVQEMQYRKYINALKNKKDVFGDDVGEFYIVDCPSKVTPAFIESKTQEVERTTGIIYDAVVVDYAGIMSPNVSFGTLREDMGQISLELKQFARNYNKILFSAVQMNREGKRRMEDKKIYNAGTEAVADSDSIANHLDNLFAIFSVDENYAVIESLKTRDGASFKFNIEKQYNKMRMIETDDAQWDDI